MNDARYKIIFNGELLPGHSMESVKETLQKRLQMDIAKIEHILSGAEVVLKKNLDWAATSKYQQYFQKCGLKVDNVDMSGRNVEKPIKKQLKQETATLTLAPIEKRDTTDSSELEAADTDVNQAGVKKSFHIERPVVEMQTVFIAALLLSGLALVLMFSPLSGGVLKKGFVLGVFLLVYSVFKIIQNKEFR